MTVAPRPAPDRHVVLLGLGHANIQVLRGWRRRPVPRAQLTCITNYPRAAYSGMLPAAMAGTCPRARMEIDLVALCTAAGARLVVGDVTAIDGAAQTLAVDNGLSVPFDVLSIGIGSVPSFDGVEVSSDAPLVCLKPMQTFLERLDATMRSAARARRVGSLRTLIVGGGAAGVELACAMPRYVAQLLGGALDLEQALVCADERLVPGGASSTRLRVTRVLAQRGVHVVTGRRVVHVMSRQVRLDDGGAIDADVIVWATGAAPPPAVATFGLPTDARGFLATTTTLQSIGGLPIFAVGDTGSIEGERVPKAGVYAVRQGPVLRDNIGRLLAGRPLRPFVPQPGFLKLLYTGDGRAIGEWKGLSFEGAWCWRLKHAIDARFMATFDTTPGRRRF